MPAQAAPADPFARGVWPRVAALLLVVYIVYACAQMEISWARVATGLENAAHFFSRLFPPNFSRWELLVKGLAESLQIAVLASTLGIVLALPIGLAAARNLMPAWATWPARFVVVACRSFHPVIVAILFVIGSVLAFGVLPQVFSRFIGFATYQLDSNLRNSTMVGIVGAGGIGGTLFAAFQRFDYDYVCAILISIISVIMAGELLATAVRKIFIENLTLRQIFRRGSASVRVQPLEDD